MTKGPVAKAPTTKKRACTPPPLSSGALRYAGKVSDVGCRMSDVGCRMSDVGCRMSDVGCRIMPPHGLYHTTP
jgi:hypothetical protein